MKSMTNFRAAVAALALLTGSLPAAADTTAPKKITFLTNYVFNGRHAPFFVGVEKGFYKDAGFDVTIAPATGSGFVITAVDSGKADYGMADFSSVTQNVAKGAKVKAFTVYTDVTTNGLASLSPVAEPADVIGKKVAAGQTDSVRVILPIIFDAHKLDLSKIDWQSADPSVYFSLLLSGQVDMFTATSDGDVPALVKAADKQGKKVHFASFADWGYDMFGYVLLGARDSIEKNPEDAARFAEATKKAVEYSIAHPDEAAEIMVKYNPTMSLDTVKAQLAGALQSMQTPYTKKNGYGTATEERLKESIDLVKTALKLQTDVTPSDVFVQLGK
ncbi:ABC transporter substrate-binding protein [Ancylobacter sp. MQZ15Z-1]|uniref:Thiamine pyrimidine synthase n=1 Tax=Ancylobacter mangrovi TaxID=2972472 RepID=A0A9X2PI31_9HYPH|nr:ABC transporter substrate-binding protein [Ancylobacter mangrovi]MCS0495632.1 ABC transporter substrate-binding protein [Ancylobacter mangrovi]